MADFDPFSDQPHAQPVKPAKGDDLDFFFASPTTSSPSPAVPVAAPAAQAARPAQKAPELSPRAQAAKPSIDDMLGNALAGLGAKKSPTSPHQQAPARQTLSELKAASGGGQQSAFISNANGFLDTMTCYELVGVAKAASEDEVKKAYKAKCLKLHPDLNPNQHDDDKELFKRITDAYQVISDPSKRQAYDQQLKMSGLW
eukprot:TRINITY_DN8560_c0_g1_i1.p1 TRINITY_DN8560_c0_g1~~TRINITY_DN8560_c0_g1_i1.p1  ORF type:complete len:200 (-),score=33.62 TRINITY_DN8560_c0_g1_i1:396-995(-)